MALTLAVTTAALLTPLYLDARLLLRNDLMSRSLNPSLAYINEKIRTKRLLTYYILQEHALGSNANTTFLIFEERNWTYAQFFADLTRVGNWLYKDLGIKQNEIVAIDGGNSPEYLLLWFAIDAIGAVPSFINCNLTGQGLVHCVRLCEARYLIADRDVQGLVEPVSVELEGSGTKTLWYDQAFFEGLSDKEELPERLRKGLDPMSVRCLIYTSGTTGLPKATIIRTARELNTGNSVAKYLRLKAGRDRMYTCMPLYHGAAHGLLVTPSIHAGSTIVLGRKFSHKTFWPEVRKSRANIIQYVGELCRYLLNAPPDPLDKVHDVKMAWGNGMRPDVWEKFRQRFGIECINELYAATDGMGACFNENRGQFGANAVAIRGLLWNLKNGRNEVRVRIDVATEDILRDSNGFAIKCKLGEPGEVLHRLDPKAPEAMFAGYYRNKNASHKRFIRDVFEKGDCWFRSGDMMRQEADGCVYFVDRLGDTFRWKSENVSTNEVGDALGKWHQIAEANVYGAQIPNADGRCGCGAVVLADGVNEDSVDWRGLANHLFAMLPRYAVPIFIRVVKGLEYTGTMKVQKGRMRGEGVDLEKIRQGVGAEDRIYWLPPGKEANGYVRFEMKDWQELNAGRVRL